MRLDSRTGTLDLGEARVLGPETTHDQFRSSPLGLASRPLILNGPWRSYSLPRIAEGVVTFQVAIYFEGESATMLEIANASPEFGRSWADWSPENEERRRAWHGRWLAETQGVLPGDFAWGSLSSMTDPKSGGSSIVLRFAPARPENHSGAGT